MTATRRKKLFNECDNVVTENIQGICCLNTHLRYLDGFPQVKVVVNKDVDPKNKVSVLSGGGAGHEPAHAGYVGPGMLAAAVVGDVFASPPTEAVLAALRAVTGDAGSLIIIMNYTGDRLNFGLATELAKAEGLNVELVIVGDDCSLPGKGLAGRRGIAGSVLVNKIASAAAAKGLPLSDVRQIAQEAADSLGSMGMATQNCGIPGEALPRELGDEEVEMGLGIHGEPGAYKRNIGTADEMVQEVLDKVLNFMEWPDKGQEYALLVNNMGTASAMEMGCLLYSAVGYCQKRGITLVRVYKGTFMTATDMAGFSVSLLKLQQSWKEYLDAEAKVPAWPNVDCKYTAGSAAIPVKKSRDEPLHRPSELTEFGRCAEACLRSAAESLIDSAPQLDEWDRSVGDGDCGATIKRGAEAILDALKGQMPLNNAAGLCRCLAGCMGAMGGTSGAVYNIFFTAAATSLPKEGPANAQEISAAVLAGAERIMLYGGAKEGSRTMLDALLPAIQAFKHAIETGGNVSEAAMKAAEAAEKGAEATKSMQAGAGRSSYVPESQLKSIPDPGAKAVSTWIRGISQALSP